MCLHIISTVMPMGNMTLAIPDELQKKMAKHKDIRWSSVARESFEQRVKELELMDKILMGSKLTEPDAEKIGQGIKAEIRKRFEKRFGEWN